MLIFVQRPISATFVGLSALLLAGVTFSALRKRFMKSHVKPGPMVGGVAVADAA